MHKGKQSRTIKKEGVFIKARELLGKYCSEAIPDTEIDGIYYDTRDMKPGGVFVCIEGENADGHKYASVACELGARVVIAQRQIICPVPVILTDDTKQALCYLTKRFYGVPKLELYGVTGTNGKTTVSYMMQSILNAAGKSCAVIGTNGTYLYGEEIKTGQNTPTTPNMPELYAALKALEGRGADCAVMEASSHALAQNRVNGLYFRSAVFTNLTREHLDYHRNMEEYFDAKRRLFDMCAVGAANADDEYGGRIIAECPYVISYGIDSGEIRAEDIKFGADGTDFMLAVGGRHIRQRINIPGKFNVYNALAAAAGCFAAGIGAEELSAGLAQVCGVCGRMERISCGEFDVIIDYAHTPDGLAKVLETLRGISEGRIICVFGCGGDRDRTKRAVMGRLAAQLSDIAVITSDNPRTEPPGEIIIDILTGVKSDNYIVIENREKAIAAALAMAQRGDTVLLAGKGQERYQIIGKEKRHFDEREIVARYARKGI